MELEGLNPNENKFYNQPVYVISLYCYYVMKISYEAVCSVYNYDKYVKPSELKRLPSVDPRIIRSNSSSESAIDSTVTAVTENRRNSIRNTNSNASNNRSLIPPFGFTDHHIYNHINDENIDGMFGRININIIRIQNLQLTSRLYNAKLRLFVRITFNNQIYTSKTALCGESSTPEVAFHDNTQFKIFKLKEAEIKFEIYDNYHKQSKFPDKLIGMYKGNIREWIANGRFEDSVPILAIHQMGVQIGSLQINARMIFDNGSSNNRNNNNNYNNNNQTEHKVCHIYLNALELI